MSHPYRHGGPELCWWCIQGRHMGSPAQWWWCWLVRLAGQPVNTNLCEWLWWSITAFNLINTYLSPSRYVSHFISYLTYRGEVMNGGFGLLLDGSEEAAKRARLMLNWDVSNGVRVQREEQHDGFQTHWLFTKCWKLQMIAVWLWSVSVCAAGGSPLLVWKLQRLWDHPAHHGGEQAAACHHALSCAGWVRAGPCPAGLTSTLG